MNPENLLKRYWGYNSFRPLQKEIINSVLDHEDTIALLPTGGGKSICFQIPALIFKGLTVVISPLIALMSDQVNTLQKRNIDASYICGNTSSADRHIIFQGVKDSKIKLLYCSPEIFSSLFFSHFKNYNLSMLVVDEAHCISTWGYDFRPSYLQLHQLTKDIRCVKLVLTASANEKVIKDIRRVLDIRKYRLFRKSFLRPKLHFKVQYSLNKIETIYKLTKTIDGSQIIYCQTIRQVLLTYKYLHSLHLELRIYHGRLKKEEKEQNLNWWLNSKVGIMVCTNAFGMGIDKSDVRQVIHYAPSKSIEDYYQEAGRAGRDGKKGTVVCLYNHNDIKRIKDYYSRKYPRRRLINSDRIAHKNEVRLKWFSKNMTLNSHEAYLHQIILKNYQYIWLFTQNIKKSQLLIQSQMTQSDFQRALNGLHSKKALIVENTSNPRSFLQNEKTKWSSLKKYETIRTHNLYKGNQLIKYLRSKDCRQKIILGYFDEKFNSFCGHCDNCLNKKFGFRKNHKNIKYQ